MRAILITLCLLTSSATTTFAASIKSAEDLVAAMQKKYAKGGGWMAPEVIFLVEGKIVTTEEYSELRANIPLDSKLFDPQYFATVHWRE